MKRKHKEMIGRIFLGMIILTALAFIITPKPQEKKLTYRSPTVAPQNPRATTHTVILNSKGFEPSIIKIKKGEVIIWTNKSGKEASVNSADHPTHKLFPVLNLGSFQDGQSVQARIFRTGELKYHNHLNPSQTGTITVTK